MKSKKSDSEKGVGPSANSRKPKAVTAKKPERTPSTRTAKRTGGPKRGGDYCKAQLSDF